MFNFTTEERKVTLFLLGLAFCGIILSNLVKVNCRFVGLVYPPIQLARLNLNKVSLTGKMPVPIVTVTIGTGILNRCPFSGRSLYYVRCG